MLLGLGEVDSMRYSSREIEFVKHRWCGAWMILPNWRKVSNFGVSFIGFGIRANVFCGVFVHQIQNDLKMSVRK